MTYFRSEQNRSRLRPGILAAFCFNRSGRIQEKASYIADIQGFLLSIEVSFWPLWSGKRDSDPRPQPWQGCALPTELFPHYITNFPFRESLTFYSRGFIHPPPDVCEPCNLEESLSLSDCECKDMSKKLFSKTFVIFFAILF